MDQLENAELASLARRTERAANAQRILGEDKFPRLTFYTPILTIPVGYYFVQSVDGPFTLKALLVIGLACAVVSLTEVWTLRRRLEAAIELIKLSESGKIN